MIEVKNEYFLGGCDTKRACVFIAKRTSGRRLKNLNDYQKKKLLEWLDVTEAIFTAYKEAILEEIK